MVYNKLKAREYRLKNKDKFKEYYLNNKDKFKEYYLNNKDKFRKRSKEYNARSKNMSNIILNDDVLLEELRIKIMRELEG